MLERRKGGLLFKHKKKTLAASMGMGQGGSTPGNALLDQASFYLPLNDLGSGEVNLVPLKALGSPTPTFTRATAASTVLSDGLIGYVTSGTPRSYYDPSSTVTNLLLQSQTFENGSWTKDRSSISANVIVAPDGTLTADKLIEDTSASSTHRIRQSIAKDATALTYTFTLYAKAAERSIISLFAWNAGATGRSNGNFNLATGVANTFQNAGSFTGSTGSMTDVGNGWWRCTLSFTSDTDTSIIPEIRISDGSSTNYNGDGVSGIYMWGAQLEQMATAGNYVPTTTTAVTRAQTYMGYLAEGARTNLLLRSEEFDNVAWTKTDTTITPDAIVSPDGTQNADLVTEGVAGTAAILQGVTATADVNYTFSCFVKYGNTQWVRGFVAGGTGNNFQCWFDIQNGVVGTNAVLGTGTFVSASIKAYPNGWYRLQMTGSVGSGLTSISSIGFASANADGSQVRVNNATRYQWGAQFEVASFASSYIPTAGSTVTRNADVLTYPFAGNASDTAGAIYAELSTEWSAATGVSQTAVNFSTSASSGLGNFNTDTSTTIRLRYAASSAIKSSLSDMSTGVRKRAGSYAGANGSVTGDGLPPSVSAVLAGGIGNTAIGIGAIASGAVTSTWFGTIRNVRIWSRQLTDAQLQAITT